MSICKPIFGEREHIFIGGMEAYIYWGDGSKSLGGMNTPIPLDFHPCSWLNIDLSLTAHIYLGHA